MMRHAPASPVSLAALVSLVSLVIVSVACEADTSAPEVYEWPLAAGTPVPLAMSAGVLVGAACGLVNGLVITRMRITPFVATLGMMLVARGVALQITDAKAIGGLGDSFAELGNGSLWRVATVGADGFPDVSFPGIPYPVLLMVLLAVMMPMSMVVRFQHGMYQTLFLDLPVFLAATASVSFFYIATVRELGLGWWDRIKYLPFLMSLGIGLSINQSRAVIEALLHQESEFARTPKTGSMPTW